MSKPARPAPVKPAPFTSKPVEGEKKEEEQSSPSPQPRTKVPPKSTGGGTSVDPVPSKVSMYSDSVYLHTICVTCASVATYAEYYVCMQTYIRIYVHTYVHTVIVFYTVGIVRNSATFCILLRMCL